jgi:regulator of sigma E protease
MVLRGLIPAEMARPVGLVGITQLTGSVISQIPTSGWVPVLNLIAMLSGSLAVVNMLPLPGLDGGRLVFVALEWLRRGRRVSPSKEGAIHLAGLALLIGLMIVITYYDIVSPVNFPEMGLP